MKIYQLLSEQKNRVLLETIEQKTKLRILTQLIVLAFNNKSKIDELPKKFKLKNIEAGKEMLIYDLLKTLEIEVKSIKMRSSKGEDEGFIYEVKIF